MLAEQCAKGSEAFKSDFKTYVGNRKRSGSKQFFRIVYSPLGQVLMGSPIEGLSEEPQEVIAREAGFLGDPLKVEG